MDVYNYGVNNTLSYVHKQLTVLQNVENESQTALKWFDENRMQANPGKFLTIAARNKTFAEKSFTVASNNIPCDEAVRLLGIELTISSTSVNEFPGFASK